MEREKELVKLVNVLRQTARTAQQAAWTGGDASAAAYCTEQYNRVLARLKELDPSAGTLYEPRRKRVRVPSSMNSARLHVRSSIHVLNLSRAPAFVITSVGFVRPSCAIRAKTVW